MREITSARTSTITLLAALPVFSDLDQADAPQAVTACSLVIGDRAGQGG